MARKSNPKFLHFAKKVFARDNHTCRYCGFQCDKFQEVVNIDQNYRHNTLRNMATACEFCAQCFFLDSVGLDGKSDATLIYLPEITQADLNHFCRALFSGLLKDSPYKGKLQTAYLSLSDRADIVDKVFGKNAKNPVTFGQSLIDSHLTNNQLKHPLLSHLRLLPVRKFYKEQAEHWKKTVFAQIPL